MARSLFAPFVPLEGRSEVRWESLRRRRCVTIRFRDPRVGSVFRLFPLDGRPQQPAILGVGPGEVYVQKRTRGKGVVPISLADFSICVRWSIGEEKSPRAWRRVGLVHVFRDEKMYRPHTTSA